MNQTIGEIKNELIDYFETIKSRIDIKAQRLIAASENDEKSEDKEFMNSYSMLIEAVENVMNLSILKINNFHDANRINHESMTKEEIKKSCINDFCFFEEHENLREKFQSNKIGLLIVTDWFLDDNQIRYLNFSFTEELTSDEVTLNKDVLNLAYVLFNSDYLEDPDFKRNGLLIINKQKCLDELKLVEQLDLTFSNFKNIEASTFNQDLPLLSELNLSDNKLECIEVETFSNLKTLKELNLDQNRLKHIQNGSFRSLASLKKLYLNENYLEELNEETFTGLFQLEELLLIVNSIQKLSNNAFRYLKKLKILDIWNNKIEIITEQSFNSLENLEELSLCSNPIHKIEDNAFKLLRNLKILNLNSMENKITDIKASFFCYLVNLEELSIGGPDISHIDDNAFSSLTKLTDLSIRANGLKRVTRNVFNGLNSLQELRIYGEQVNDIEELTFKPLANIKSIQFYVNSNLYNQLRPLSLNDSKNNELKAYFGLPEHFVKIRIDNNFNVM